MNSPLIAIYNCRQTGKIIVVDQEYRKKLLIGDIATRIKELFYEIAIHFNFEIQECEVAEDHIHILISFPPRYSVAKVVGIFKSISGSKLFKEFPKIKKQLWGGHFWEQGYFFRTVGEHITTDIIRNYIVMTMGI